REIVHPLEAGALDVDDLELLRVPNRLVNVEARLEVVLARSARREEGRKPFWAGVRGGDDEGRDVLERLARPRQPQVGPAPVEPDGVELAGRAVSRPGLGALLGDVALAPGPVRPEIDGVALCERGEAGCFPGFRQPSGIEPDHQSPGNR